MFYSFPFLLVEHSGETSLCVLWLFLTKCLYFESKNFGDSFITARTNTQVHFWFSLIILHTVAIFTLWIQFSLLLRFIWCQPFAAILLMISWFDAKWFKRFVTLFCKTVRFYSVWWFIVQVLLFCTVDFLTLLSHPGCFNIWTFFL